MSFEESQKGYLKVLEIIITRIPIGIMGVMALVLFLVFVINLKCDITSYYVLVILAVFFVILAIKHEVGMTRLCNQNKYEMAQLRNREEDFKNKILLETAEKQIKEFKKQLREKQKPTS